MEKNKFPTEATQIGLLYHTRPYLQIEIEWANHGIDPTQIDTYELENWLSLKLTMKDGSLEFIDLRDYEECDDVLNFKRGFSVDTWYNEDGEEIKH